MVRLNWHNDAKSDILQIYNYIYRDSIYYAIKTINGIADLATHLETFPYMRRKIPEFNEENNRELIYKSYRIMYRIESNKIVIHRIWHSARLLPQKLIS